MSLRRCSESLFLTALSGVRVGRSFHRVFRPLFCKVTFLIEACLVWFGVSMVFWVGLLVCWLVCVCCLFCGGGLVFVFKASLARSANSTTHAPCNLCSCYYVQLVHDPRYVSSRIQ